MKNERQQQMFAREGDVTTEFEMRVYQDFVMDLNRSQLAVLAVAGLLQASGNYVFLPPHRVTPDEKRRYEFTDHCDLIYFTPETNNKKLQVKWSSRAFASVEEFGFQWITVDESYKIEQQREDPPTHYFIVNNKCTGSIVIPWKSEPQWDEYQATESRQGGRECFYRRCPSELCMWRDLPTPFREEALSDDCLQ